MMIRTFKVLSALLSYPSEDIVASVKDMHMVLSGEHLLSARQVARLTPLLDEFRGRDLYDLQERYVLLFDRTRSLSLHMFEHVHGESRDRGQAMVDLKDVYEEGGHDAGSQRAAGLPAAVPRVPFDATSQRRRSSC